MNQPFALAEFVTESNRIEGLGPATPGELLAHEDFLSQPISVVSLARFVATVADAELRMHPGMDVRVGRHFPPRGGEGIVAALKGLLADIIEWKVASYEAHQRYETLHPFMDGNGRSGRALWLWQMGGIERAPLGFLHHFYYQSLDAKRVP